MRIEQEVKLDYKDVLIRPKRSTLRSRKQVSLERTYKFRNSHQEWSGIPIMAANMDGVGELGVAEKLSEYGMITCLTKQHDVKKIKQFKKIKSIYPNVALSIGIKKIIKNVDDNKNYGLGFYSSIIILTIFIISFFGILNLTKDIVIFYYPFLESYILYLYETIENIKIIITDFLSVY